MKRVLATTVACAAAGLLGLSLTANSLAQMDEGQSQLGQQNATAQGEQKTITGQLVNLHTFMTGEQITSGAGAAAGAGTTGLYGQHGQLNQENQPGQTGQYQSGQTEQNQPGQTDQNKLGQTGQQSQMNQPGAMNQSRFGAQAQAGQQQPEVLAIHTTDGKLVILDIAKVRPTGQAIGQWNNQSSQSGAAATPGQSSDQANPAQSAQPGQEGTTATPGESAQPGQSSATATPGQFGQPGQEAAGQSGQQQWQRTQQDAQRYLNRQVKVAGTFYEKAGVQYLVAQTLEPATASARSEQQTQSGQPGAGG